MKLMVFCFVRLFDRWEITCLSRFNLHTSRAQLAFNVKLNKSISILFATFFLCQRGDQLCGYGLVVWYFFFKQLYILPPFCIRRLGSTIRIPGQLYEAKYVLDNGTHFGYLRMKLKYNEISCSHFQSTDRKFQNGMKIEAVNPFNHSQICVATITKIAGRHIWLHFDGSKQPNHIVDGESQDIFPVGWCDSVGYPLKSPKRLMGNKKNCFKLINFRGKFVSYG